MGIEIKQLLVKSNVLQARGPEINNTYPDQPTDLAEIRLAILSECKQMITEALRAQQER